MSKCYFHGDLDGCCSGAIVNKIDSKCEMIKVNYNMDLESLLKDVKKDEQIYIVDFAFKPELMEKVLEITKNVIWIDHHKTVADYKYSQEIKGLREFKGEFAGCELVWKYFYNKLRIPKVVEYIGDMDKWAWKYGDDTANFTTGLELYKHEPKDKIWKDLLDSLMDSNKINKELIKEVQEKGKICIAFRNNICSDYIDKFGFEVEFESHKCFALNLSMFGSLAFGDKIKQYDMCVNFAFDGENYTIGLYSEKVDVGVIAKKYNGGGHKGASGFTIKELPFKK